MAKKKRKKRVFDRQREETAPSFNYKLALLLFACCAVVMTVYFATIKICEQYGNFLIPKILFHSYIIIPTVLAVIFIIMNRGVSSDIPSENDLPSEWDGEKKKLFLESYTASKKKARKIMLFIIPFIVTLMADFIIMLLT